MAADSGAFDPYHEWLGIHPSEQPADFYRLLGVCRFENNVAVIQGAYIQRFQYLQRFRSSGHGADAERLIQELASAQTALLSPVLKASYDGALRVATQPPPAPPQQQPEQECAAVYQAPSAYFESPQFPAIDAPTRPIARKKQRQQSHNPLLQMAGSVGGLVLGFLILCFLRPEYDRFHLFHAAPIEQPEAKKIPSKEKIERVEPQAPDVVNAGPWRKPVELPPPVPKPPIRPAGDAAAQVPRLIVPSRIGLPALRDNDGVETADVGVADAHFDIRNPEGNPLEFEVNGGDDQQSWSITAGQSIIANLKREDGKITFYWSGDAPDSAECLRNALLVITVGGNEHEIMLRSAAVEAAPLMDLSKAIMTFPADIELHGLKSDKLQLEVIGTESGIKAQKFDPADKKASANQKVRLILRDQPPYAAFDVSLSARGNSVAVKVWPIMAGEDKDTVPWTIKSVNTIYRKLGEKIKSATAAVQQLPQAIRNIQSQMSKLKSVPANSALYFAAQNDLANAQVELEQTQAALADAKAGIPRWQNRAESLKVLADLGNSINGTMRISYRVFYVVAGHEVDLFQATGKIIAEQPIVRQKPNDEPPPVPQPRRKPRNLDNPIAADLFESLDTVRTLLASRELEASRNLLEGLLVPEGVEDLKNSVENAKLVQHYVERFWNAVRESVKTLESGKDFGIADADRAAVVEIANNRERITLRIRGENRTYSISDLPTDAAVGIASLWLAKDDPNSKVFVAAFIAVDAPQRIDDARKLLREAKSSGSDVAQAVLDALDDV